MVFTQKHVCTLMCFCNKLIRFLHQIGANLFTKSLYLYWKAADYPLFLDASVFITDSKIDIKVQNLCCGPLTRFYVNTQ